MATEARRPAAHPFVGRGAPLRALVAAARAAADGHGALAVVSGEPGIGKTCLVEELAEHARGTGFRVLWANCWRDDGVPAFWPWIQLVRAHARDRDPALLAAELEAGRGEIGHLVPDLASAPAPRPGQAGEEARFRLFDALATFLRRAAEATPLLLVVEDMHWADTASLLLLRFVARELRGSRILVVGTYRDAGMGLGLGDLLGSLAGSREHVVLQGLDEGEVGRLVEALTGAPVPPEQVASVHRRTGGNPLFIRELVRLLADAGGRRRGVPDGIGEVIRHRLALLSAPCRALLSTAAVIGLRFRRDLLAESSGLPVERVVALLDEAVAARLLEEDAAAAVPHHRFSHALVAEVLYQWLTSSRRQDLHHRAGLAIEAVFADRLEPRLPQLAHHFRLAGERAERGRAAGYAVRAGRRAAELLAYEEAAGHFQHALELLEADGGAGQVERCGLLLALAEARKAAGEVAAARRTYELAADLARTLGEPAVLARIALGVGLATTVGIVDHLEIRLLEEALGAVGDEDSLLRTRLLARLARTLLGTSSLDHRRELSDQAVAIARRLEDPGTLAAVLLDRHSVMGAHEPPEDGLAMSSEVIDLAGAIGDRALGLRARALRMGNLLELGRMDELRTDLEVSECVADELRQPQYRWHIPLVRASLAVLAGRLEEAEGLVAEGLRLGERAQEPGIEVYTGSIVALIRYLQGRLPELDGTLRELIARYPGAPGWRCVRVLALSDAGRSDDAAREFELLAAEGSAPDAGDPPPLFSLAIMAVACDALGDARRAAILLPKLSARAGGFVQVGQVVTGCLGSAAHYAGLLCCAMSRWDEAVAHFERAIEMNARIGAAPFVANSRFQLARALLASDDASARAHAVDELELARETAGPLGLRLWRGGWREPVSGDPPALSAREWEIAWLVADGLRNGEIAARLFISKRTVETHVEHIRRKLDLESRAGIMSWVMRRRVPQPGTARTGT